MADHPVNRKPANALITLKMIVEKTAPLTGVDFFRELVRNLAQMLNVYGVWIAVPDEDFRHLDAVAFWLNDDFVDRYYYKIEGTPCEMVFQSQSVFHVPKRVVELFPKDPDLKPLGAVSYMGVTLKDKKGKHLGHLAVLDNKPMPELPDFFALLNIFATRAAAELERLQYENTLAENEYRLSQLVSNAFDAILEIDDSLIIQQTNPAAQRLFSEDEERPLETDLRKLLTGKAPARSLTPSNSSHRLPLRNPPIGFPDTWNAWGLMISLFPPMLRFPR